MSDTIRTVGVVPFVMVPVHIVRNPDVSFGARCLYSVLASYSSSDRTEVFPSNKTLSCQLGCDVRTIQRLKIELQEKGLLTVGRRFDEGRETTCLYHLQAGPTRDTGVMGEGDMDVIPGVTPVSYHELEPSIHIQKERKEGSKSETDANFAAFWSAYPTRHGPNPKKTAETSFKRLNLQDQAAAIQGAHALGREFAKRDDRQFIPMASTYLNQRRWECQQPSKKSSPSKPAPKECPEW